jgi:NADH-quinone oxidoreductase subunit L
MVTAGVFLIARMFPLISAIEIVSSTVAYIGGFTLIFAATMALVSNDIKRVLAYSSISQLGYMFLALGTGAYGAAILHLFTHAWFKALLFLGAGSVGHAVHTFDMTKMGGLKDHMKITYWTMMLAAISLIGIFPFSGFWSKDEVLLGVSKDSNILFYMGLFGVILTGFYMTRMMLMTFFGDFKGGEAKIEEKSLHESPKFMIYPMILLAIPSVLIGFIVSSPMDLGVIDKHLMVSFLDHNKLVFPDYHHHEIKFNFLIAIASSLLAFFGIIIAIFTSRSNIDFKFLRKILVNKYYLDYLYEEIITENLFYKKFIKLLDFIEINFIDKASHSLSNSLRWASNKFAITQNGQLQIQSITFFLSLLIIISGYFLWLLLGGN